MATPLNPLFCLSPATFGQLIESKTIQDINSGSGITFDCHGKARTRNYKFIFDQPDKTKCYVGNDINDINDTLMHNAENTVYDSNYLTKKCDYAGYYTDAGTTFENDLAASAAEWKDVLSIYAQVKGLSPGPGITYADILAQKRQNLIKTDIHLLNVIGDMQRTIDKQTNELVREMPSHKETLHNKRGENQTIEQRIVFSGLDFWNKSEFSTLLLYGGAGLIVLTIVVYLIKRQTSNGV